jgi:hypothetical protein
LDDGVGIAWKIQKRVEIIAPAPNAKSVFMFSVDRELCGALGYRSIPVTAAPYGHIRAAMGGAAIAAVDHLINGTRIEPAIRPLSQCCQISRLNF